MSNNFKENENNSISNTNNFYFTNFNLGNKANDNFGNIYYKFNKFLKENKIEKENEKEYENENENENDDKNYIENYSMNVTYEEFETCIYIYF
jgi:hypothetical protein